MSTNIKRLSTVLLILFLTTLVFLPVQAQENDNQPIVRAVLFYSPTCPHCEKLIYQDLPPLLDQYGDQVKIVAINVATEGGQTLYQSAVDYYGIPEERLGVPTMIVNDVVMVGGEEVPAQFPGIIAEALADNGTDWPAIPGLADVIANVQFSSHSGTTQTSSGFENSQNSDTTPMVAKFLLDPVANSIAVAVLIGMVAGIVGVVISFSRPLPEKEFWPKWIIPLLSVLGMGVAFYLTYVETSGVEAVCGPVGDCNSVQLSPYAILFGVLPVGLLGLIGYALILIGWGVYHFGPQSLRWVSAISVWGMAFFGVLFSIYLTFLEPFVIGATCMWCISSAILISVIFFAATGPAKRAWQEDSFEEEDFEAVEEEENQNKEIPPNEAPSQTTVEDEEIIPEEPAIEDPQEAEEN
jgi:uncharacterized membrane protein/thiol-disulfide isomerase/thioredoxin